MNKQAKQPSIKWVLNRHSSVPVFEGAPTPNHSITRFDLTQKGEVVETKPWDNYIKTELASQILGQRQTPASCRNKEEVQASKRR